MDSSAARVLIVDDDRDISLMLAALMKKEGLSSLTAYDGETALQMVPAARPDMLLVDVKMPGIDGMEVLKRVKETDPHLPVVLITAYAEVPASVAAMRAGAFDYLAKPFDHPEVIRVVRAALAERDRRRRSMAEEIAADNCLRVMMGPSDAVTRIIREVNRVAQSDFSVIVQGETGSGKELVARAIYQLSGRAEAPFIPLDCGAIPETLIESELFGYQKGAFTGAIDPQGGNIRSSSRRHPVPGRDRQSAPGGPGETAAGPPGEGGPAPGRGQAGQGGRAPGHRQQPGTPGTGGLGPDAGGSVLPPQ